MEATLFGVGQLNKKNKPDNKAKQNENIFATIHHSWFNMSVHVIRSDHRCLRCKVGQLLVMADHQVGVELLFRDKLKNLRKVVSPLFVATVRLMWLNRDVVSEDEAETTVISETQPLPSLCLLPSLGKILTMEQKRPLEFLFKQTSLILSVI
jgi:hypothetical protein